MITALASIIIAISVSITSIIQTMTLSGCKLIECCSAKCIVDEPPCTKAKESCSPPTTLDTYDTSSIF